jgi:hypothetical protein
MNAPSRPPIVEQLRFAYLQDEMRVHFRHTVTVLLAALAMPVWLSADVACEQSVTIVRGSGKGLKHGLSSLGGGDSVTSKTYVRGELMIRSVGKVDELFDLEHQTVTRIRHDKKTYSVLTFEQYGTALHLPAPAAGKPDAHATGEAKFDVRVDDPNRTKKLNGVELRQKLVNITQDLSDSPTPDAQPIEFIMEAWIASDEGDTDEFSRFNKELAEKLGTSADVNLFPEGMTPALRQGMIRLLGESQQLNGVLIEQTTRVTGPANAGFDSGSSGGKRDIGKQAKSGATKVGRGIGNVLGRMAGGVISGGTVPVPDKAPIPTGEGQDNGPQAKGESGDLLQMAVSTRSFSNSPVDESHFKLPADYQKVDSELLGQGPK